MKIFNKRNAVIGWLAVIVGRRFAKRKMRSATAGWRSPGHLRRLLHR